MREEIVPGSLSDQEKKDLMYVLITHLIDAFDKQMEEGINSLVGSLPLAPAAPLRGSRIRPRA